MFHALFSAQCQGHPFMQQAVSGFKSLLKYDEDASYKSFAYLSDIKQYASVYVMYVEINCFTPT